MGRPLTMILPGPGRMRTRATACLRRPVVWTRGLGTVSLSPSVLGAGAGEVEDLGRLGDVGVLGPGVDLELTKHLAAEGTLGQHASDRLAQRLLRLVGQAVGVPLLLEPAGVGGMAVLPLLGGLVARPHNL